MVFARGLRTPLSGGRRSRFPVGLSRVREDALRASLSSRRLFAERPRQRPRRGQRRAPAARPGASRAPEGPGPSRQACVCARVGLSFCSWALVHVRNRWIGCRVLRPHLAERPWKTRRNSSRYCSETLRPGAPMRCACPLHRCVAPSLHRCTDVSAAPCAPAPRCVASLPAGNPGWSFAPS